MASRQEMVGLALGVAPDRGAAGLDSPLALSIRRLDFWSLPDPGPVMSTADVAVAIDDLPSSTRSSKRGRR